MFNKHPLLLNDYENQQCKQLALTITQPIELPEVCQKIICGLSALTIGRTLRKFSFVFEIETKTRRYLSFFSKPVIVIQRVL